MKTLWIELLLITMLASVSTLYVWDRVIDPNIDKRMQFEKQIISGEAPAPYCYRILKPALHVIIEN